MKQTVPFVIDWDAVVIERIYYWPEVVDHVSRKCPLPVSIPEAWRSEVLAMVLVSDQVMGCHVSLMTVHVVGHSPFLMLDVGLFAIYTASLHPSPRRPPTHRPRHCPARPRPPHQRRPQRCPEAHQRHCRTSPHYPPGVNKKWRVSSATLCLNDHRFWCCHLGEVMHPSKFENCGHAVEEAADDEPVQGRGIMNLNRRGCYRSLMTKT